MGYKRVSLRTEAAKGEKVYSPSKTFYPNQIDKDEFDYNEWRESKRNIILTSPEYKNLQHQSHLMIIDNEFNGKWDVEKIKSLDDVSLQFVCNIITNGGTDK